jgi:hypothetical protein
VRDLKYTATKTGRISIWSEGRKLSEPWEYLALPFKARKALHQHLSADLVRGAWVVFGTKIVPGHLHSVRKVLGLVQQVLKDNVNLLPTIFKAVSEGDLKTKPFLSLVQRLKALTTLNGMSVDQFYAPNDYGCMVPTRHAQKLSKRNEVIRFWVEMHRRDEVPLSPAGWRFFQRQSSRFHRALGYLSHTAKLFGTFNRFGELGVEQAPLELARLIATVTGTRDVEHSEEAATALIGAWNGRDPCSTELTRRQIDLLRDWWYEEKLPIVNGTRWETLVARATDASVTRTNLVPEEMRKITWPAPIVGFVSEQALVVTPLLSGAELIEEGAQANNCLRNTKSYAIRALQGRSQVFRIQGGQGRATVEMVRNDANGSWRLGQIEGPAGSAVLSPAIHAVVQELELRMNEYQQGAAA